MLAPIGSPHHEKSELGQRHLSQLMASNFPDGIYLKDARRRYLCLNEAEGKILGLAAPDDAVGKAADRFVSAKRARIWRQEDTRVLVTGEPLIDRIEESVGEDGSVRWLSATKAPLRNSHGAITGIVGITRDITQVRHAEQLKDQCIATLSHELRTPVSAITGTLSLVASGAAGALPDAAARLLKIADANCERLLLLINDFLDLEKLTCGMMVFELQQVDVHAIVEKEIAATQSFADPFGVQIRLDGDAEGGTVRADPVRLAQVISNLLSNAVKFSPRGAAVAVTIENRQGTISIHVRDHGPGIPAEFKDRVFDKFVQVNTRRADTKRGTGLGLSIVKQIVGRLHGDVSCAPARGGGTVFSVTLPSWERELRDNFAEHQRTGSGRG
jgi:PAS domain S-box-containing protein